MAGGGDGLDGVALGPRVARALARNTRGARNARGVRNAWNARSTRSPNGFCCPAGRFFGVVAGFAKPLSVGVAGWSGVCVWVDVVDVTNRCIAPRCPAGLVAGADQPGQPGWEIPGAGVHRDQLTAFGVQEKPPQGDAGVYAGLIPGSRAAGSRAGLITNLIREWNERNLAWVVIGA